MKFRGLLAAAVVLVALGGALYWSQHHNAAKNGTPSSSPAILNLQPATVSSITIKAQGAAPVVLMKSPEGRWQITAPTPAPADATAVYGMLSAVHPLAAERVVEDDATNLAQFGLSDPAVEIDLDANGKTTRLLLGDGTPVGDAMYVSVAGNLRVYTAARSTKTSLDKSENQLRDRRLVPVNAAAVSHVQLERKGESVDFVRDANGWQMRNPEPYATDSSAVDNLVQQVTAAEWDPSSERKAAAAEWTHAQPFATVRISGQGGSETFDLRKEHEDYYAKSSALPGVWKVDTSLAPALSAALDRSLDEFRSRQIFDFGYADPDKIEYHSSASTLTLTHNGSDWYSDGRKMNAESAEAVVSALRDLAASRFVEAGFNKPAISLVVTFANGKRVQKIDIQPTADGAIAKRSDNPSLYFLDQATVDTLTSALAGVKGANALTPAG